MSLAPGTRLGPHEIVAPLGAGGMGEVYRARDTRLGREVAIKVLPAHLSAHPEVRSRFEREARTISSLNHPHICMLHDVGREGDTDYLVMELIDGETLAQRLARGPLPVAEVLRLGAQIADALDRAHRAGVVHRDLKPGNVMLTRAGAKLMDFGLARSTGLGPAGSATLGDATHSPTVAAPLTAEGTIVGTFQYMAPEQLEGKEADARSDLWALGCVLHEMATGKRAFDGASQASLITAIMASQPRPISEMTPLSPLALDRLVGACLAKDPADRVQSAHDVRLQLEWMAAGPTTSSAGSPAPVIPARRPAWIPIAATALVAVAATAAVLSRFGPGRTSETVQRYTIGSAVLQPSSSPLLSPDGAFIVLGARDATTRRLYRRDLSSFEMSPIAGTDDGNAPFFSPDGAWIGFVTPTGIKKVPVGGGAAQTILNEPRVSGADWGRDGTIYFTPRSGGSDGTIALARVPATGGALQVVARLDREKGEAEAWLPEILPDGKTVLITITGGPTAAWHVDAVRADGTRHLVVDNAIMSRFTRDGRLFYFDTESKAVLAAPFDPAKARITGPAVPLTEAVDDNYCFDVSESGRLVYVPAAGAGAEDQLVWLDRKGAATVVTEARGDWIQPRVSPDGRRILVRKNAAICEIWMADAARGTMTRVASGSDYHDPVWSPDGSRVAYHVGNRRASMGVFAIGDSRKHESIAEGGAVQAPHSWTAAGNRLAYTVLGQGTRSDIWVRPMDGSSPPAPFLATEFNETDPAFSPDGKWLAYSSTENGAPQVFLRPYPDTGTTWNVSAGGVGSGALWSRDGREIFYQTGSRLMAVPVETRPDVRLGTPVPLFDGGIVIAGSSRNYDVAPDGRFVAIRPGGDRGGQKDLRMLLNWQAALKQNRSAPR